MASLHAMLPYLRDRRYLTHQGRKVIVVYRPQQLPDSKAWVAAWRDEARNLGLGELHLVCALTHGKWSYTKHGFDAGVEFPPHGIEQSLSVHLPQLGFLEKFRGTLPDLKDVAKPTSPATAVPSRWSTAASIRPGTIPPAAANWR